MTKQSEEKEPAFKVVDRRRFTEQGEETHHKEEESVAAESFDNKTEREESKKSDTLRERPSLNFSLFVQSLGHQAMMGLGIIPWPDSGLVKTELTLAQETIDILQILKDKTVGNLSKEEAQLLEGLVYQLKIAFVNIAKKPSNDGGSIITR